MHRLSKIPIQETKEILYITQKSFSNVFEPETIKVKNIFKFKLLHYWRSHLIQNKVWDMKKQIIIHRNLDPELRIRAYETVQVLHFLGLTSNKIKDAIYSYYNLKLSISTISEWISGIHKPLPPPPITFGDVS